MRRRGRVYETLPLAYRLWRRIERGNGCWLWTAATDARGYGRIMVDGRAKLAYRVMYELLVEPVPAGLELDHLCRNKRCVNPAHLEPVTHQENMRRGYFGQKTHCPQGHPYSPENTFNYSRGRVCRTCSRTLHRCKPARGEALLRLAGEDL